MKKDFMGILINKDGYKLPLVSVPTHGTIKRLGVLRGHDEDVIREAEKATSDLEFTNSVMREAYKNRNNHNYMNYFNSDDKMYWHSFAVAIYIIAKQRIYSTESYGSENRA